MDKQTKNIGIPIQDLMRQALGITPGEVEVSSEVCTVKSIDGILCDCSPIDGSPDLLDVRLKVSDMDGVLFVPTIGSVVTVAYLNKSVAYITQYSQLDSIKFMDGSLGGLAKIITVTEKLNNLENKMNDVLSAFNSHIHAGVQTGAGSSGPPATPIIGTLTPTLQSEIEDTKITH